MGATTPPHDTDVVIDAENTIEPDSRATPPPSSISSSISSSASTSTAPDAFTDDGYDTESVSGDSTSLASSVRDYVFENNRRYHKYKEGRYLIPNDDPEQEREDMKHAMIVHLCGGKLHFAPLEDPQEILDIGTGTGIWAIDMADEYPSAKVVGIDLSPIQPVWTPPNAQFYVDDAEEDWVNGEETLDYVHARHMSPAIKDWEKVMQQAYRALKPGGWIELQDILLQTQCDDDTMPADYKLGEFMQNLHKGFGAFKVNLRAFEQFEALLDSAGFVNITSRVWKVPIGTWPLDKEMKKIGLYNRCVIYDALQNVSLGPYTRGLGWTANEVEVFLVDVRKAMMDASIHSYYTFHVFYAQKPTH